MTIPLVHHPPQASQAPVGVHRTVVVVAVAVMVEAVVAATVEVVEGMVAKVQVPMVASKVAREDMGAKHKEVKTDIAANVQATLTVRMVI